MKNSVTSQLVKSLITLDPVELMAPIVLLLACALPAAAFVAGFGVMEPGTFLQTLLVGVSLSAMLIYLRSTLLHWVEEKDDEMAVWSYAKPMNGASEAMPSSAEEVIPGPWEYRSGVAELRLNHEDYAQYLLDDAMRGRDPGHVFHHQGP